MGEVSAGEVGRRIGLFPSDVVENLEAELLQGVADGEDYVKGTADPYGAVRLEYSLAAAEPFEVEFMIEFGTVICPNRPYRPSPSCRHGR